MKLNDKDFENFCCRGLPYLPGKNEIKKENLYSCSKLAVFPYSKSDNIDIDCLCSFSKKNVVEVRFKNSRKDFYEISGNLRLQVGDIISVEASPGHDIGIISAVGLIAFRKLVLSKINLQDTQLKKVYRKAKESDILKWFQSIAREHETYMKAKAIITEMGLDMRLNDVEFQGDGSKAIFYYTATDRVDFRELIKVLAKEFLIRVEMKQIGARQEAARLGGIGSCGRELCCSTWIRNFSSIPIQVAKTQQIILNPQKITGHCTKLKCCLNYEFPIYVEALKDFPDYNVSLKTQKGNAVHVKSDIFKNIMWYAYENDRSIILGLPIDAVRSIIDQNLKGIIPESLELFAKTGGHIDTENIVDVEEIEKMGLTDEQ